MANITIPIQVNLPDDWTEQVVDRPRNNPDADWVDVIRCKNCKHWSLNYYEDVETCFEHRNIDGTEQATDPNDFCSWAERREDG